MATSSSAEKNVLKSASKTFREDVEQVIGDESLPWNRLQGTSVLVTGATGLIGTILVRMLRAASDRHKLDLHITGMGRSKEKLAQLVAEYGADAGIAADIRNPLPRESLPERLDCIFHCASVTRSAEMAAQPVDVIATAVEGTRQVLEIARERNCRNVVFLSSMEVYGQTGLAEVCEADLGYLDLSSPRSGYPESKRLCESLCTAYASQYGVPVKIARLAQVFGAGTPKDDSRVFAQFARSAMNEEDIVLHTEGKSRGNYCYTSDAVSGLLYILLEGNSQEAYNVANPQASVTICEMAELVAADNCSGKIKVVVEVPKDLAKCGYAAETGHILNADKLKALGWQPRYGLKDMYARLLNDWGET